MRCPATLVQLLCSGHHGREELPKGWDCMYKFFSGCDEESRMIGRAFASAARIECVLFHRAEDVMVVHVSFYDKAAKEAGFWLRVAIDSNGTIIGQESPQWAHADPSRDGCSPGGPGAVEAAASGFAGEAQDEPPEDS